VFSFSACAVLKSGFITGNNCYLLIVMRIVSQRIRHLLEAAFSFLLFGMQSIYNMGVFFGFMTIPLLPYVWFVLTDSNYANALKFNVEFMLFAFDKIWVGRIIAFVGVAVLLLAAAQFLWSRYKGVKIIQSGLYSRVRHPQFTGIILITVGLTVMIATWGEYYPRSKFQDMTVWLLQVFGYIAIAKYEDWNLLKTFGDSYRQYQQKVPFLFPIRNPKKISETLFTVLVATLIWAILLSFPFYSSLHIT
jgi:protein-S-isoprenylcysteine O-methyltransferase Ste14